MNKKVYKCTVGSFDIKDAFTATDLLFEKGFFSTSCAEKNRRWFLEILDEKPVKEKDIAEILRGYNYQNIEIKELENVDWLKKCFENFRPIIVGNFYIYGPHLRGENIPKDKTPIEIAAATAFGTGEHPTTNRCLAACQTFFDDRKHKTVLDIGCGSCILSIALAKLGARNVVSCDNDSEAVRISKENIVINRVAHRISVFQNRGCEFASKQYDFIVANILSEPLIAMSNEVVKSLSKEGILVLSGFTSDDNTVLTKYQKLGLALKHKYKLQGWTTLVLEKA